MDQPEVKPDHTLVVIVSIIAALVAVALAVVFLRGTTQLLDPSTPEGVVQSYSLAVIDGDTTAARAFLTQELQEGCDGVDGGMPTGVRVTLVSTKLVSDTARVRVSIQTNYDSGPFGGSSYEQDGVFVLVNENDTWAIDTTPWPLAVCYDNGGN